MAQASGVAAAAAAANARGDQKLGGRILSHLIFRLNRDISVTSQNR
jgi:hypothetical protein